MALKLDELINKKKEPNQILDLSKVKIRNREEFEKYFDKIPEYKIRPEKVRQEDIRVRDSEYSFKYTKKEARYNHRHEYPYGDACPASMKSVRLEDLAAVDISWRMLTMLRPKNRLEEDIFNRIVELGKLRLATRNLEAKQLASAASGAPGTQSNAILASMGIIITKNKRGSTETRIKTCKECGLELCPGTFCKDFPYDSYTRLMLDKDELENEDKEGGTKKGPSRRGSKLNKGKAAGSKAAATGNAKGRGISNKPLRLKKKKKKKKKKKTGGKTTSGTDSDIDDD